MPAGKSPHLPRLGLALRLVLFLPLAAHGTVVTTSTDEDNGSLGGATGISLREAVKYSPTGDTITFAPGLTGQTIRLTLGALSIAQSLTIDGSALPVKITLSGDKTGNGKSSDDTRIIDITSGTVLLESLILDRGYTTSGSTRYGGAIRVSNSVTQLTLRNSTISNCESNTLGGGIYFLGTPNSPDSSLTIHKCNFTGNRTGHDGGAIHMSGTLRVEDSTFSNNIAFQGCAIFHRDGVATVENSTFTGGAAYGYGGAICNEGTLTLRGSSLSGNSAPRGGGICNSSGTLTVETSTIFNNSASGFGGGIYASGILNLLNSTLAGNTAATSGGGLYCDIVTASLKNTTVTGNSAGVSDGGIYNNGRSPLTLGNTVVAGNSAPTGLNLSGNFTGSHNLISGNPFLAPLGDYGGKTRTMPPFPGSPAIDSGSINPLLVGDQRGFSRDSTPDIGAVEYKPAHDLPLLSLAWAMDVDGDGKPYGVEQALGTEVAVADSSNARNLTVPAINASGHAVLSFGCNSEAVKYTCWILKRSPDLVTFTQIYRHDRSGDSASAGVSFIRTATSITVTDENPPSGGAFYRFEALLEP